jgi:hypothetical protein
MAMDTFVPMLGTLSTLLDKGAEHMRAKGLTPDTLVDARLAPDMFPLTRQVQIACDQAKSVAALAPRASRLESRTTWRTSVTRFAARRASRRGFQ